MADRANYNGIINVYKEKDFTSFDVVAKLRGICGQKKIGHTGTLDPDATGVLPVCLGNGTKLCEFLTDHDKEYVAEVLLGVITDTQDISGTVLEERPVDDVTETVIREVIADFQGEQDQIPPMYSALKVNGQKLCDLARRGIEVERKARKVFFYEIEVLSIEMPVVKIRVHCSKGTYIRTLCDDIGKKIGCGATMKSLVRTKVANFSLENALSINEIQRLRDEGLLQNALISVDSVFSNVPAVKIKSEFAKLLENGNKLTIDQVDDYLLPLAEDKPVNRKWIRVYRENGEFAGLYEKNLQTGILKPEKMFL